MPLSPDPEAWLIIITILWILNYKKKKKKKEPSPPRLGFNQERTTACVEKSMSCVVLGESCPLCMNWAEAR